MTIRRTYTRYDFTIRYAMRVDVALRRYEKLAALGLVQHP